MPMISCPHCGARRNTPLDRLPKHKTRARCPECGDFFSFDPNSIPIPTISETPVSLPDQLTGIGPLLSNTWALFCRRGWELLGIYLLALALICIPLTLAALLLPSLVMNNKPLAWSCLILGIGYGLFGSIWLTAAMFHHIVDPHLDMRSAFARSRNNIAGFFWLMLLLGIIITGASFLLLVPGLIFMVWFFFSQYILAEEKIGGLAALEASRRLVQGHGWEVFGRFLLLLLISIAVSALTSRLPVVGGFVNLAFTLLLTPFSLLYYYLIYQDLKRCRKLTPVHQSQDRRWLYLTVALIGWLLIPGILIFTQRQSLINLVSAHNSAVGIISQATGKPATLAELTEDQTPQTFLPKPEPLTASDYDRLLREKRFPGDQQGVDLGPAILSAKRFWVDKRNPHLWLEVKLADLPNLALSARRSARILIEQVLDTEHHDQYNPQHSFESAPFQWIDIQSDESDNGYSGIRNVYLKQGTRPEQISSISGRLELTLPLGIESLRFKRQDVGKVFSVDGNALKLVTLDSDRLSLSFQGKIAQILSVRAFNRQEIPLREEGETWQSDGQQISLQQMFNGQIDAVTVLVATDTLTRSYPFEITR